MITSFYNADGAFVGQVSIPDGSTLPIKAPAGCVARAGADQTAAIAAQWMQVRAKRDQLLTDSDWTQLPDSPVDKAAWAICRQEWRDLTNQTDPFNLTWPTPPGALA